MGILLQYKSMELLNSEEVHPIDSGYFIAQEVQNRNDEVASLSSLFEK